MWTVTSSLSLPETLCKSSFHILLLHTNHYPARSENTVFFACLVKVTDPQQGPLPKNDDKRTRSVLVSSSPKHDEFVMFSLKFHKVLHTKQASCQSPGPNSLKQSTNLSEGCQIEVSADRNLSLSFILLV